MAAPVRLGLEHEYSLWSGPDWLDARALFDTLDLDGVRIHPTERQRVVLGNGLHVHADGPVLEAATPPVPAEPGAAGALAGWAAAARRLLSRAVPPGLRLEGESTHLSVSVEPALADRTALLFAQTFAPGLMLLMDRPTSPGLLVRPRPGRLELCGEFVEGPALQAATLFALAGARACEGAARARSADGLPPAIEMTLEPARLRHGWYVGPDAPGADLHAGWRDTPLRLLDGTVMPAGEHLRRSWETARPHLAGIVTPAEAARLDALLDGDLVPPTHDPTPPQGLALHRRRRPGATVTAVTGTWDFVAFRIETATGSVVLSLPAAEVPPFLADLDAGALDTTLHRLAASAPTAVLHHHEQTLQRGVYRDVAVSDRLLPLDYMGVGNGEVTPLATRGRILGLTTAVAVPSGRGTGKPPVTEPPPVTGDGFHVPRWGWVAAALIAVVLAAVAAAALFGGGDGDPVTTDPPPSPTTPPTTPPPPVPPPLREVAGLLDDLGYDPEAVGDILDVAVTDDTGDGIYSASVHRAGDFGRDVDITRTVAVVDDMEQREVDALFNDSVFECGARGTVCPDGVQDIPAGPVVLVGAAHRDPLPGPGDQKAYVYGAVFDGDGLPGNDYQAVPPFDWDLFQGSDRWYQLNWDPAAQQYDLVVHEWRGMQTGPVAVPSAARALVRGKTVLWVVPASEFGVPLPGVRATAFRHDGTFHPDASGADVPGPDPTGPLHRPTRLALSQGAPAAATPTTLPAPSPRERVEEFVALFNDAHARGDAQLLLQRLHPAVIERYGRAQCRTYLQAVVGQVRDMEVLSVEGPSRQPYETDGIRTLVPRGYAARVRAFVNDTPDEIEAHFAEAAGTVRWFTDCGQPV